VFMTITYPDLSVSTLGYRPVDAGYAGGWSAPAEDTRRFGGRASRLLHLDRVVGQVGLVQVPSHRAAVGVWLGAHAPVARWVEVRHRRYRRTVVVEQLVWSVRQHPALQCLPVLGVGARVGQRHLVTAPEALDWLTVDLAGPRPADVAALPVPPKEE
jgi:hypothetical protein